MIPPTQPPPAPPVERHPFWGFADMFLFIGLALPAMVGGGLAVKAAAWALHWKPKARALELVPAEFLGYTFLFAALYVLFRVQYDRPFWRSLGWLPMGLGATRIVVTGALLAFGVALLGALLRVPDADTPMKQLLSDRPSVFLIAVFGVTLGPVFEELAFRGFFQPLLVRVAGRVGGVLLAALPFGLLHLQQYGFSWRHAVLVCCAGVCFGWMKEVTGSTKAAALMHAAYNGIFFLGFLAQRRELHHPW